MGVKDNNTDLLEDSTRYHLVSRVMDVIIPLLIFLAFTGIWINMFGEMHSKRLILCLIALLCLIATKISQHRGKLFLSIDLLITGALVVFSVSTLVNGGVQVPNYIGFLAGIALASTFLSNRTTWMIYGVFLVVGLSSLFIINYDHPITYPTPERYFTIYAIFGLIITLVLTLSRNAFQDLLRTVARRESLVSSVFESIKDSLFVLDEKGVVQKANAAAELFIRKVKASYGVTILETIVYDPVTETYRSMSELIKMSPTEESSSIFCLTIERKLTWYTLTCSPYCVNGESNGVVLIISDVTEQQKLMQIQKMNAVGILANGIAHDFNNMIGAIKSSTELLLLDVDSEHHDLLHLIEEASDRSATLIRQLRLFSRGTPVKAQVLDLNELVIDVYTLLKRTTQHKFELTLTLHEQPLLISGERELLHMMLMNLGLNAVQSMTARGGIWFKSRRVEVNSTSVDESSRLHNHELTPGTYICLEVGDEGKGMTPAVQERIFEPFFTTRSTGEGVGLGLAAVHGAVSRHQGVIEVESQLDHGSSFFIYLPLDSSLSMEDTPSIPQELIDFSNLSVLIIDDEPLVRKSLKSLLEALEITVTDVESGQKGLEALATVTQYDLIILDMLMPNQDGYEVFKELQLEYAHIPIVLSSGFYPEELVREMEEAGLAGKLHKPYGLDDVKDLFNRVLS